MRSSSVIRDENVIAWFYFNFPAHPGSGWRQWRAALQTVSQLFLLFSAKIPVIFLSKDCYRVCGMSSVPFLVMRTKLDVAKSRLG